MEPNAPATNRPAPEPTSAPPAPARARNRKQRWRLAALILLPILLLGGFLYYWFFSRPFESTDDAFIEGDVVPVAPRIAGQVVELHVQDNQRVEEGDLIAVIDPRDYQARVAEAQAGLLAAQTRLDQARAQMASDEALVEQQRANLVAAEAEARRAETDLKRYQALNSPAVSRSQVDLAAAQARSNQAAVDVARSRTKAAEAQVALSQAAIQTANAEVQRNEAAVRRAQLELSYTRIVAPQAGFVTRRTVQAGSYVQPGQALLALVPKSVWVVANFKETQLVHMKAGQPVEIRVDAYQGRRFRAHVDSIQRGSGARFSLLPPENATGNYVKVVQRVPVKIVFDDVPSDLVLGPGMSVVPKVRVLPRGSEHRQEPAVGGKSAPRSEPKQPELSKAGQGS